MLSCMLKSTFEPSGTLVLWGGSISFCKFIQILFQIGWISLNGTAMQLDIEVSLWPYQRSCFLSSKTTGYIMVTFFTQLVLKNTMPFLSIPQSTLGVFCQFILFFLMLQPHRPSPAMRNLALFKEPALWPQQTRFFHRPHLLAQDFILLDIQGHSWWHEPYTT